MVRMPIRNTAKTGMTRAGVPAPDRPDPGGGQQQYRCSPAHSGRALRASSRYTSEY